VPLTHAAAFKARALLALFALVALVGLAATQAHAAASKPAAEQALVVKLVHKYGVGTKARAFCKARGKGFRCVYVAAQRTGRVYMGNANVDRRRHVRFLKTHCVTPKCKGRS